MRGWPGGPRCLPLAAHPRGATAAGRGHGRRRRLAVVAGRPAAHCEPGAGRRRDHPGAAAEAGGGRSSETWRSGCTSRPKASSRPPGCRSPPTGQRGCGAADTATLIDLGCGIGGDLRRLRPRRDHLCRRRPRPGAGRRGRGQPRGAGPRRCRDRRGRHHGRHLPLRRGLRRSCAPVGARAQLRRRRLDPAVGLRADAPGPRLLREGRPRHPARPRARRRRGGVGQRPPRGQGGGALVRPAWPPPAAAPRSSATAGWRR